jgi:hypothetical protein
MLDALIAHYRDTGIYARAAALSAMVDQKLAVEAMEASRKPSQPVPTPQPLLTARITSGTTARITNTIDTPTSAAASKDNAPVALPSPAAGADSATSATTRNKDKASSATISNSPQVAPKLPIPHDEDEATSVSATAAPKAEKRGFFSKAFRKLLGRKGDE